MLYKILIGALCAFATLGQAASAPAYSVQLLPQLSLRGSLEGTRYTSYLGFNVLLNDKGQVAATTNSFQPVIWSNGTITALGSGGTPLVINNSGQVAISAGVILGAPEAGSCYLWSNGTLANIGNLGVGCWQQA